MNIHRLNDKEWQFLEQLVRLGKGLRGRPPKQHRQIFDAIFWVAETNSPWRNLPKDASKWNTVYRQFKRWSEKDLWKTVLHNIDKVAGDPDHLNGLKLKVAAAHRLAQERVR